MLKKIQWTIFVLFRVKKPPQKNYCLNKQMSQRAHTPPQRPRRQLNLRRSARLPVNEHKFREKKHSTHIIDVDQSKTEEPSSSASEEDDDDVEEDNEEMKSTSAGPPPNSDLLELFFLYPKIYGPFPYSTLHC